MHDKHSACEIPALRMNRRLSINARNLAKCRLAGITGIFCLLGFLFSLSISMASQLSFWRFRSLEEDFSDIDSPVGSCKLNPDNQVLNAVPSPFFLHYIRFKPENGSNALRFIDYLSVMSGVQYLKPDGVILHGDFEPEGEYWKRLHSKGLVRYTYRQKNLNAGQRQGRYYRQTETVAFIEHAADMAKLDVLLEYGGIAVDFDVFFVRGQRVREILTRKKALLCYSKADGYNIGFIAAQKDSKLLYAWRRSYEDIYVDDWNFNQARVSKYLAGLFREETYVADRICNNPTRITRKDFFHRHGILNWKDSIAIHSYERFGGVPINSPADLAGPLTGHKELLRTIYRNLTLPPENTTFRDEIDPLTSKLI